MSRARLPGLENTVNAEAFSALNGHLLELFPQAIFLK